MGSMISKKTRNEGKGRWLCQAVAECHRHFPEGSLHSPDVQHESGGSVNFTVPSDTPAGYVKMTIYSHIVMIRFMCRLA